MARAKNPLAPQNRNAKFTGAQVASHFAKLAASKRARVVRDRSEFDPRQLMQALRAPFTSAAGGTWRLEDILAARDQQMAGRFRLPARLAESFRTDDALFTAISLRLAPVQSLAVKITAGRGQKADKIADEGDALFGSRGVAISHATITSIREHLANHGIAFGKINWSTRDDGSRRDPLLESWPIEFVWWDPTRNGYLTQARHLDCDAETPNSITSPVPVGAYGIEQIVHGDGRWVVFAKSELNPHRLDAALLPGALVWATHAFGMRDWRKGSSTQGNAKVVGEMAPDTPLTDAEGNLTREAAAFLALVMAVASQDAPAGIRPSGSKIDYMTDTSKAWEVWAKLAEVSERAAARIYLGTDGVLGAVGGAPGVDISELLGVSTGKIQSDLECVCNAISTGLIAPWCAWNFGDDKLAPTREYVFPDPDESRVREDYAKRSAAFLADMKGYKDAGFRVDQELVDRVADLHGVPAPIVLDPNAPVSPAPTPTDSTETQMASRGHLVRKMPAMPAVQR